MELLGAIVVVHDIRSRREWENRGIQSQRMEAIAALAGGMAERLDVLLFNLLSQVDDLQGRLSGEDRARAVLVRQSSSRIAAFGSQLATLGRRSALQSEVFNVNRAILALSDTLADCVGPDLAVETGLHPYNGFVQADRSRFQQVLLNLALHAKDVLPQGGPLRIETAILDLEESALFSRRHRGNWFVRIRVIHPAGSLDDAALAEIFEPSFVSPLGQPSTRFGLATAHSIVTQGGGHIAASAREGQIAFEILWPCIGVYQDVQELRGNFCAPVPLVMVVEAEDSVRRSMSCCLEREGYPFIEAKTPEHAALVAVASGERIAALVAPLGAEQLAFSLNVPTLYLSGYRHDQAPNAECLPKPFPIMEFHRRIRALARPTYIGA
jgi:two-component system cell cycle sensor histidine kinase/response regulator CckA